MLLPVVSRPPSATGGNFSHGYIVQHDAGRRAFLKALDFHRGFTSGVDPSLVLEAMTTAFNHERDLCIACKNNRLSHVVSILGHGFVYVDTNDPFSVVQYLIFEKADGDIRSVLDNTAQFDIAWALRSLHNAAVGLNQLHGIDIAHQDLKPSNVLTFNGRLSKVGDLGHAATRATPSPLEGRRFAADPAYAPLEQCYGFSQADLYRNRLACDMYLFGSLVTFMFVRLGMTALISSHLDASLHPAQWGGTYAEILPYLKAAFGQALGDLSGASPKQLSADLTEQVLYLCEPDPEKRGHPRDRIGHHNQYALGRFITRFDVMARRAELGIFT